MVDAKFGRPYPQILGHEMTGTVYQLGQGITRDTAGFPLKLGDRVEIYCTNLDMSTNAFDRYYVAKGDQIVDVWPIMGRGGAAQR